MYTSIVITKHSQIIFFIKLYNNIQTYPLISFWFVNIYQGEVPHYGVCLPCGPIHMGKFLKYLTSLEMVCFRILDTHIRA